MGLLEQLSQFTWSEAAQRWFQRGRRGAVSDLTIRNEMLRHTQASASYMETLTNQLYSGQLTGEQWRIAMASELKNTHGGLSMFANGGRDQMTPQAWGRVGGNLRTEYRNLQTFADQIAAGEVPQGSAVMRSKQYAQAGQQAYWRERSAQDVFNQQTGLPVLNQVPGDGQTRCHGNCGCHLQPTPAGVMWILGKEDNCPDCPSLALGGPYQMGSV